MVKYTYFVLKTTVAKVHKTGNGQNIKEFFVIRQRTLFSH